MRGVPQATSWTCRTRAQRDQGHVRGHKGKVPQDLEPPVSCSHPRTSLCGTREGGDPTWEDVAVLEAGHLGQDSVGDAVRAPRVVWAPTPSHAPAVGRLLSEWERPLVTGEERGRGSGGQSVHWPCLLL